MLARKLIAFFIFAIGFSGMAMAEEGPWYAGIQAAQIRLDDSDFDFDSAFGVGVTLGYKFNKLVAVEGGYTTTGQDGDVTDSSGVGGDWDWSAGSVYAVLRSSGNFYAKGKLGYLHEKIKLTVSGATASDSDSGLSWGIGGGWRAGEGLALELEYTKFKENVDFISLGVNLGF